MRLRPHPVAVLFLVAAFCAAQDPPAKNSGSERTFPQPVTVVQATLQSLPGSTSGRLPVLDGFVVLGPHPLSSYQRPYYQCDVHFTPVPSGGSLVRVTAKITAWFSGPGHSGYQVLESNGRVESDLLDRLAEALASSSTRTVPAAELPDNPPAAKSGAPEINAPMPRLPDRPALSGGASQEPTDPRDSDLQMEARTLEEILRNQSHPTNLIAVKQDNAPVVESPASDAKVLFLASAEDEFEMLDANPEWVHVRISGLSRGWLRRSTVELLGESHARAGDESVAAGMGKPAEAGHAHSPSPFVVSSEEIGGFPGEWAPLRGKNVKIISLQKEPGT